MKTGLTLLTACSLLTIFSCTKGIESPVATEDGYSMAEIGSIDVGDLGAAEISAFDPISKRLFIVNNSTVNKIDVVDLSNPAKPVSLSSISLSAYGGYVNSLAVHNGKLAAAIEAAVKQDPGKLVIFNCSDSREEKLIPVGALPDMVTYSPDGKYILTANEGEPNDSYTNDPMGTVSIITVPDYTVTTIDFSAFSSSLTDLRSRGFRVFGPGINFAKDIEPEYITVSSDSRTAWITLQENNGIAQIDLLTKAIVKIMPLGYKHYGLDTYKMDLSDRDNTIAFNKTWNVKGMFQPDAIAVLQHDIPLLFTANEGDAREYAAFAEVKRIKDITLDPFRFQDAGLLRQDANLGRLNITTTQGDTDGDGDFDELYSYGARSFSIWNGNTGALIYDSRNELDVACAAAGLYDDGRSDDKGAEPEGLCIGKIGNKTILFVGLERADAVALYDISYPYNPVFIKVLRTGDAPEGLLFIPAGESPNGKSLLVVSSENDGLVKVYCSK